ncbi:MAG TPA: hypothetical protein G4O13_06025 [Dehalococcoidia bacterium]|nr:hypothetical protein [Dehalococcoidia bacterium]
MTDESGDTEMESDVDVNDKAEDNLRRKNEELRYRISQLEEGVATRDSELNSLKESLSRTVARYRDAVLASIPGLPMELLKGETVDEIDASLELAQGIVSKVRQQLEAEAAADSVPAGAPPRTPPDLSALSPVEKIAYGMARQG